MTAKQKSSPSTFSGNTIGPIVVVVVGLNGVFVLAVSVYVLDVSLVVVLVKMLVRVVALRKVVVAVVTVVGELLRVTVDLIEDITSEGDGKAAP